MRRGKINRRADFEIEPDEVLLDASNLPEFDTSQFQGRIIAPIGKQSLTIFAIGFLFVLLILAGEAFHLQVSSGAELQARSEGNRLERSIIFADRGVVLDRNGEILIGNTKSEDEFALREYRAPGFGHLLGYVSYPNKDTSGYWYSTEIEGVSGIEARFDDRLRGENGLVLVETNARGEESSSQAVLKPFSGENITLTIDAVVQESLHKHIKNMVDRIPFQGGSGVIWI